MINTIVGAGVLALPFAFGKTGLALGILLLLIIAAMSAYTGFLLVDAARITQARTYAKLGELAFGRWGRRATDAMLCCLLLAACIGYMLIIGDIVTYLLTRLIRISPVLLKRLVILAAGGFLGLLTSMRTMTALAKASIVALCAVTFITFCIVLRGVQGLVEYGIVGDLVLFTFQKETLGAVPLIGFALSFHMGLFPLVCEARDVGFMKPVIVLGLLACLSVYLLVGVFGYAAFQNLVLPNVIDNYPSRDILMQFARGAVVTLVSCSFPLLAYPVRIILDRYLFIFRPFWNLHKFNPRLPLEDDAEKGTSGPPKKNEPVDDDDPSLAVDSNIPDEYKGPGFRIRMVLRREAVRRVFLAYLITAFCMFWAIVIPNIAVVFGLAGATCGTMLIFVFPCVFYMKMQEHAWYHWRNILPTSVCMFGVIVLGLGGLYSFYLELSSTPFPTFTLL
eukprot:TRINITY_DN11956_c0_g1_i1.p1 TRINITY_DN11956_c0_g1~~TRINITY_DN11956_c0_g1_i1.p1  ORF type:complete len:515 (-),score=122.77 TRINITY_DN11956_c0_g1_i1:236-1582(-)